MKANKKTSWLQEMKCLKPLVMMQLKERISSPFLNKKEGWFKTIIFVLLLSSITALIYLIMSLAIKLSLFSVVNVLPISVIVVVFTLMFGLSIVVNIVQLTKALYFSKDNLFLLTMPAKSSYVFFSKIIVFYISELYKNLFSLFPFFLAYGIISHLPLGFYFTMPLFLIFISAIPVIVAALLSIPAMLVSTLLKKSKLILAILFTVLIAFVVFIIIKLIGIIPADLNIIERWGIWYWKIQNFLNWFVSFFSPITYLTQMITGTFVDLSFKLYTLQTLWTFLIVIATIVVGTLLCYFASRPLFLKMASKPFEYDKKIVTNKKLNNKLNKNLSIIKRDGLLFFRNGSALYSLLAVAVIMPVLTFFFNKLVSAMSTRMLGQFMAQGFNIMLILIIVLSSSVSMASAYSREGNSSYVDKTRPVNFIWYLFSKLIFNIVIISISTIISCAIMGRYNGLNALNILCICICVISCYIAHLLWSAELDIMNPKFEFYQNNAVMQNNPNESKSSVFVYVISFLLAIITIFLLREGTTLAYIKIALMGFAFLIIRIVLFIAKIKLYYNRR